MSWGDLSPSMAYLHGPMPGSLSRTKSGSTRELGAKTQHTTIKKPLSRAIRVTNLSFEDIIQKYKRGGAKTKDGKLG